MSLLERRKELFSLLSWHMHHDDWCPGDTLLRLAEKAVGVRIPRGKIVVAETELKIDKLVKLQIGAHTNKAPFKTDVPIILFWDRYRRLHILDGQNRINLWRATGEQGPFRCLVAKIKS